MLRGDLRFGHSVYSDLVALFRIVADVPKVQIRPASPGSRPNCHVFPIYRLRASDSPDPAMFSLAIESVDERPIAAVIVSPENAGVASRAGDPAALLDGLVLQVDQMNRRPVAAAVYSDMIRTNSPGRLNGSLYRRN